MKKLMPPLFVSVIAILSVACASHGYAQSPAVTPALKLAQAQRLLGLHEGDYALVSSENLADVHDLKPAKDLCGDTTISWSTASGPVLNFDMQTTFFDFNRGVINETSKDEDACVTSFKTTLAAGKITYIQIDNQKCHQPQSRTDSNLTVNGDVVIYNFNKHWMHKEYAPIAVQCVLKLKK